MPHYLFLIAKGKSDRQTDRQSKTLANMLMHRKNKLAGQKIFGSPRLRHPSTAPLRYVKTDKFPNKSTNSSIQISITDDLRLSRKIRKTQRRREKTAEQTLGDPSRS